MEMVLLWHRGYFVCNILKTLKYKNVLCSKFNITKIILLE